MDDKPIPPMTTASNDPAMTTASNDPAMTTSTNDTEEFAMDITRASPAPTPPNLPQWNANSDYWDRTLGDGNSMFTELILPTIEELAELKPGQKVLDLGTGNGIVARRLADAQTGVEILACDYSEQQLHNAQKRTDAWYKVRAARGILDESKIEFERLDLLDRQALHNFASLHPREFDVITASMLLKELYSIEPLAQFLAKVLKSQGKIIIANLHPCFHKPAAHRVIEVLENPRTGEQEMHHSIKVSKYLNIEPVHSQALRGQPEPLVWFHRPIHQLLAPFFQAGLVMDRIREPAFSNGNSDEAQSYTNFGQIPMQFIFRLTSPFPSLQAKRRNINLKAVC